MIFKYNTKKIKKIKKSIIIKSSHFSDIRGNLFTIFNNEMQKKLIKKKFRKYHDKIMVRK